MISNDRVQQDFRELIEESRVIELQLHAYFRGRGYTIVDKAEDLEARKRDIDFEISMEGQKTLAIEVKADKQMWNTGNVMVEYKHNRPNVGFTKGWYFYCDADIICYHDTRNKKGYMVNWKKLKPVLEDDYSRCGFDNPHDIGTRTLAYLLPVEELRKKGFILEEYTLN